MRILVAHNFYRSAAPSGENAVVQAEIERLTSAGVEVLTLFRYSDDISKNKARMAQAAIGPLYAPTIARDLAQIIRKKRPSVIHVHNVFPMISPHVVTVASRLGVPVIQTVHNYRHTCVNGMHFRRDRVCTDCIEAVAPWPAVVHACYRGSRLQSGQMALSQLIHTATWRRVSHFFALTEFMANHLIAAGIDKSSVSVRPNWADDPGQMQAAETEDLAFVGRLDASKGVPLLLDAWKNRRSTSGRLLIAGDGPLRPLVEQCAARDRSIEYSGRLSHYQTLNLIRRASGVILPSLWFEGFPLTVVEAFSCGRPVVALRGGSAASVVTESTGWVVEPSAARLSELIDRWDRSEARLRGASARREYLKRYTPQVLIDALITKYAELSESCSGWNQ